MTQHADRLRAAASALPLARRHMPDGYAISLDAYIGRDGLGGGYCEGERRIPADFGPPQSMRGFEATYRNIIDYIVRITYKIWEDRDVHYIEQTYSDDSNVFDDYGLQLGNAKIVADTLHTTGAFSDIQLIADEIVWAGDDQIGYHTSHRTLIRGTNTGDSKYGPATGRTVDVLVIANCVARGNRIFLEHVLYNNSSLLVQLGLDLEEMARRMAAAAPAGWPRDETTWEGLRRATRPTRPISEAEPVDGFDVDAFVRANTDAVWNRREPAALTANYREGFSFEGATDRAFEGAAEYRAFQASLFDAFPDLSMQIDEVYWMGNDDEGYLTSERWSADATHSGAGRYGAPTGARVQIWGITQHRIVAGRITEEWMLFNELDLMMQITRARGEA